MDIKSFADFIRINMPESQKAKLSEEAENVARDAFINKFTPIKSALDSIKELHRSPRITNKTTPVAKWKEAKKYLNEIAKSFETAVTELESNIQGFINTLKGETVNV